MTSRPLRRTAILVAAAAAYAAVLGLPLRREPPAVQPDPMSPAVRAAEVALHEGRAGDALALVRAIESQYPESTFIRYLAAVVLREAGSPVEEATAWEAYLAHGGSVDGACPDIARAYERAGDTPHALEHFRRCADSAPDNAERRADLARALTARRPAGEAR